MICHYFAGYDPIFIFTAWTNNALLGQKLY
jgi:hypothetical protein